MERSRVILVCVIKCAEQRFQLCQILLKDLSQTQAMFIKYLAYAKGSAGELRAQLYIARDQGYITAEDFNTMFSTAEICSRQLSRFIQYLESQPNARRVREEGATCDVEH